MTDEKREYKMSDEAREAMRIYQREYRAKNPERVREIRREYRRRKAERDRAAKANGGES